MADLTVNIGGMVCRNPVMTASGTCGFGSELEDFFDNSRLGAIMLKGTTLENREGNPYPRMAETPSGMLNSVGLQNKGIEYFIKNTYPVISEYNTNVVININGGTIDEYVSLAAICNDLEKIPAIELNISCPNVKMGGMIFGTHLPTAREVIKKVREVYKRTLIVKLSPNVTSVIDFARVSEEEGADAISLINTLVGMAVDLKKRRPALSTITGGLSGPAIKPVALRMVWQAAGAVKIPVIGMGGIMTASDALEFLLVGASAIQVGTATFIEPDAPIKILEGISQYLDENDYNDVNQFIGSLNI